MRRAAKKIQKKETKSKKKTVVTDKGAQADVRPRIDTRTDKRRDVYQARQKDQPSLIKEYQAEPEEGLPAEYGENNITLMVVDPYTLFAYWEVREDALKLFEGSLSIRLYDVTGVDFDYAEALSYTDFEIENRIGSAYLHVADSKEYIMEIGIIYKNVLITIERSNRVHTPISVPEKLFYSETSGDSQLYDYEESS